LALREYDRVVGSEKPIIIGSEDFIKKCGKRAVIALGLTFDEIEKNYFGALRVAEKTHTYIILQTFKEEEGKSIMNRILKSSGGVWIK
jgi:hypothetical protein